MRIKPNVRVFAGKIDVVPLINVVFLLLIFFMISSSLVFQPGIPVELPIAVNPAMNTVDKLVITITRSDLLFFNDKPVQWDELERELRELVLQSKLASARRTGANAGAAAPRAPLVVLRADKNTAYNRVMQVMAMARSLNLGVYLATGLGTKPTVPTPRAAGAD